MASDWKNLSKDVLILIAQKLGYLKYYYRFSVVCKSWKSATESEKPWLPPGEIPMLLLAENVAPELILSDNDYDFNEESESSDDDDYDEDDEDEEDGDAIGDDDDEDEEDGDVIGDYMDDDYLEYTVNRNKYVRLNSSVGNNRGLYSLSSKETYNIELPEAAGRLIVGTNKGWLVTLDRDMQINLLHPLLRHQISLPPMITFLKELPEEVDRDFLTDFFIQKVAISSEIFKKSTAANLYHQQDSPSPVVMSIYGDCKYLAFARLGDKVWTGVNVPSSGAFDDINYHKGNFYAVDCHGDVYMCFIDDEERGEPRGKKIASVDSDTYDWDRYYLVETVSGSSLSLVVRRLRIKRFDLKIREWPKYRTIDFEVWRLDIPSGTFTQIYNLGNEAIFVGRASSFSVSSSEIIKTNCIYFTDDNSECFICRGGGHDMGIFDIGSRSTEPHFQGKSIHPFSPPLWYI